MTAVASPVRGRDSAIIGIVGAAHFASHFMQLVLPPLFVALHDHFGASYTELGLVVTLFFLSSGFGQSGAGVLVDRSGAGPLLALGLVALSLGTALYGLVTSYWMLLPLAVLAGLGNSVFHPADLSILSHRVTERRLGRAFAAHTLTGTLGFAAAPLAVTGLTAVIGWRGALISIGCVGFAIAALVYANRGLLDEGGAMRRRAGSGAHPSWWRMVASPLTLMAFAYFCFTAFASNGLQAFGITALRSGYGVALESASFCVTIFFVGSFFGLILGGFLAERTEHHDRVAIWGVVVASLLVLAIGVGSGSLYLILPALAIAGGAYGVTAPSRDVLVRRWAMGAGLGSVFGFVYSGFDLGTSVAPVLLGALVDRHEPRLVFVALAVSFALAAPTVMRFRRMGAHKRAAQPAAAE